MELNVETKFHFCFALEIVPKTMILDHKQGEAMGTANLSGNLRLRTQTTSMPRFRYHSAKTDFSRNNSHGRHRSPHTAAAIIERTRAGEMGKGTRAALGGIPFFTLSVCACVWMLENYSSRVVHFEKLEAVVGPEEGIFQLPLSSLMVHGQFWVWS